MRAELLDNPAKRQAPHTRGRCGGRKRAGAPARPRFTGELRRAWRRAGGDPNDPTVKALIEAGVPPVAGGMPTGMDGAAFMSNLPPEGTYIMNTKTFARNTERNDVPQQVVEYPGFGQPAVDVSIAKVGVLSGIQIMLEATLTTAKGTGTVTPTHRWPWGMIQEAALSANGQTSLIAPSGIDMRSRHGRVFRNPRDPITEAPSVNEYGDPTLEEIADGEYTIRLLYEVPIVHDWFTLTGSLYMQSDQIYLALHLVPPAVADLFTLTENAEVTLSNANFRISTTFFDVPFANADGQRHVLVPDLQWLHGFISENHAFANNGDVPVPLIRTSGQLLALYAHIRNGANGIISPGELNSLRMEYGANRIPRKYEPVWHLLQKNSDDYNGLILPEAGVFVLDFEADNPSRDLVFPKGVTELKVVPNIPSTITPEANSGVEFAEEALFAGA